MPAAETMLSRSWRTTVRDALRKRNYDLVRFTRMQILEHAQVDLVLDVGANVGQFAQQIRRFGYCGTIISFEPLEEALTALRRASKHDKQWIIEGYALGATNESTTINVTANLVSSSILPQQRLLVEVDPSSAVTGQQIIEVRRLDTIFDQFASSDSSVALKIDTQGYERQVLEGGNSVMNRVKVVHLEASLVPLYEGELLLPEALDFLGRQGFNLASIEPGLPDLKTGQLLQVDLTMVRP